MTRMVDVIFPNIPIGISEGSGVGTRLLEDGAQPVDTGPREVRCGGPDRPEVGSRSQLELLEGERAYRVYEALIGELPALIKVDDALLIDAAKVTPRRRGRRTSHNLGSAGVAQLG